MDSRWSGRIVLGGLLTAATGIYGVGAMRATPAQQIAAAASATPAAGTSATSGTNSLGPLQAATIDTATVVEPKVVLITSPSGLGSGEVIDPRGYIVTNYHVLSGGGANLAPPFRVTLGNGKSYTAKVAGTDAADDLAVLKISAGTLKPIAMGDSSQLKVGQFVLAVGNPLGYSQTVTFGIVSTLGRGLPEGGPATFLPDLIQTSAPINPGNSGGALVDLQGRLVGIPTLAAQDPQQGTAAQGIGFAIPVNRVKFITSQIIKSGKVTNTGRAYLGISALDVTPVEQQEYDLPVNHGVYVARLVSNGPAAHGGLKVGDIITAVNGRQVTSNADLLDVLSTLSPGKAAKLQVTGQDGKTRTVTVTLGTLPAS